MRKLIATVAVVGFAAAAALSAGCSRSEEPNSLFDDAGYHVREDAVYYLNPFPGNAFELEGADASTFTTFDRTYARDRTHVFINGTRLPNAHAESFRLLDRPGFSKDRDRVYQHDQVISTDPDNFRLLPSDLASDSANVYWSDGTVLSRDPQNFTIISDENHYLFAKDAETVFVNGNPIAGASPATFHVVRGGYSRDERSVFYFDRPIGGADVTTFRPLDGQYAVDAERAYWMGEPIEGADPDTFVVLNANFECSTDGTRVFYRQKVIEGTDPTAFPPDRVVTGCSESTISFGE